MPMRVNSRAMTDENNAGVAPQKSDEATENTEPAPRPKTPLELVRESQIRNQKSAPQRGSGQQKTNSAANSYKRRQHQRRAG